MVSTRPLVLKHETAIGLHYMSDRRLDVVSRHQTQTLQQNHTLSFQMKSVYYYPDTTNIREIMTHIVLKPIIIIYWQYNFI